MMTFKQGGKSLIDGYTLVKIQKQNTHKDNIPHILPANHSFT